MTPYRALFVPSRYDAIPSPGKRGNADRTTAQGASGHIRYARPGFICSADSPQRHEGPISMPNGETGKDLNVGVVA